MIMEILRNSKSPFGTGFRTFDIRSFSYAQARRFLVYYRAKRQMRWQGKETFQKI